MIVKTFLYQKEGKLPEERELVVLNSASDCDFGIDVTELDTDSISAFLDELVPLTEEYNKKVAQLMEKHDLKYKFRKFKIDKMTNVDTTILP